MALQNFIAADFLRDYWQQRPLLIKSALPNFISPLTPDELAGLACEDGVESRLIIENKGKWRLEQGPFAERRFQKLPKSNWTLLVQSVDHYVPEVAAILEHFLFLPRWRIDDIMISYAAKGGSVGPHYDNYDVFLLQGAGVREWRIGQWCDDHSPRIPHDSLRLLADFREQETLTLHPGDILYLPPRLAHWGIAQNSGCMTYSVGFRAPSYADIIAECCDDALSRLSEDQRYRDEQLTALTPGEIGPEVISQVRAILHTTLLSSEHIAASFARLVTRPKYDSLGSGIDATDNENTQAALIASIRSGRHLERDPAARLAYIPNAKNVDVFINGESLSVNIQLLPLVKVISDLPSINADQLLGYLSNFDALQLLSTLAQHGLFRSED